MVALPIGRRLTILLAVVGLVAACATGASPNPSTSVTPSESASLAPSPSSSVSASLAPSPSSSESAALVPPSPVCPSPPLAVSLPDVTIFGGGALGVVATRWSSTTMTCTNTQTEDSAGAAPSEVLSAKAPDQLAVVLPDGWGLLRAEVVDRATTDEATTRPPIDTPDRPTAINVPLPTSPGDSIVGLNLWIIRADGRVVGQLDVGVRVRVVE